MNKKVTVPDGNSAITRSVPFRQLRRHASFADQDLTITLDDLLVEGGKVAPFRRSGPTYTAMGRFGNVMLINGETEFSGTASVGEVVRLFVVNTANTRMFRFGVRNATMKLVGGDSGRLEHEVLIDDVLLAPSERAVIDVLFDNPGEARLEHRTPNHVYDLGAFDVRGVAASDTATSFATLRSDPELTQLRAEITDDVRPRAGQDTRVLVGDAGALRGRPCHRGARHRILRMPDASRDRGFLHDVVSEVRDGPRRRRTR